MGVNIVLTPEPVSPDKLKDFESQLRVRLPQGYRDFLLTHNGGVPIPSTFGYEKPSRGKLSSSIQRFWSICDEKRYSITEKMEIYKKRMPQNLLPIATTPSGDIICISLHGSDQGNVYIWKHEWEADEGEEPSYDNVYFISSNFDEFLNSLYDEDDD